MGALPLTIVGVEDKRGSAFGQVSEISASPFDQRKLSPFGGAASR